MKERRYPEAINHHPELLGIPRDAGGLFVHLRLSKPRAKNDVQGSIFLVPRAGERMEGCCQARVGDGGDVGEGVVCSGEMDLLLQKRQDAIKPSKRHLLGKL